MSAPSHDPLLNAQRTGYTRSGFAARYHAYRPTPPEALIGMLLQLAQTPRPDLVVDLGSGTGLSTGIWAPHAQRVVGIEPLDAMRQVAQASHPAPHVHFHAGVAQQTGLPDGTADIVTCAQSLHDMEPQSTLAEVARILRGGGVFAAYDYDWPPVIHWEAEQAFCTFTDRISALWKQYAITDEMQQWVKHNHLERMWRSDRFR